MCIEREKEREKEREREIRESGRELWWLADLARFLRPAAIAALATALAATLATGCVVASLVQRPVTFPDLQMKMMMVMVIIIKKISSMS